MDKEIEQILIGWKTPTGTRDAVKRNNPGQHKIALIFLSKMLRAGYSEAEIPNIIRKYSNRIGKSILMTLASEVGSAGKIIRILNETREGA